MPMKPELTSRANSSVFDTSARASALENDKCVALFETLGELGITAVQHDATLVTQSAEVLDRYWKAVMLIQERWVALTDEYQQEHDRAWGNIHAAARAAHEANRAYCQVLGDFSQVPWDEAPEWQKNSAISGVLNIYNNPDTTPEDSHSNWLNDKARDGWTYGAVKDIEKKEHPCFVPYSMLPPEQRRKDHIFGEVVRAVLRALIPDWPVGTW
jgi:hypothetical protein